jgi:hypothetical protein
LPGLCRVRPSCVAASLGRSPSPRKSSPATVVAQLPSIIEKSGAGGFKSGRSGSAAPCNILLPLRCDNLNQIQPVLEMLGPLNFLVLYEIGTMRLCISLHCKSPDVNCIDESRVQANVPLQLPGCCSTSRDPEIRAEFGGPRRSGSYHGWQHQINMDRINMDCFRFPAGHREGDG